MFWDFHTSDQETIHALMFPFDDRGLPSSTRHINAFSGNTYKFSKADRSYHYSRTHVLSNQGLYFTNAEGAELASTNRDDHIEDPRDAIEAGWFPSWDICIQMINPDDIEAVDTDIFDMAKLWPHKQYLLRKVGRMMLDKNPDNWFAEIEQAAFSPSNMVRDVEPSPDTMLQARMFAYLMPLVCPIIQPRMGQLATVLCLSLTSESTERDLLQVKALWDLYAKQDGAQKRFVRDVPAHMRGCKRDWMRSEVYAMFGRVNTELGEMVKIMTEHKIENNHKHPHKTAWH